MKIYVDYAPENCNHCTFRQKMSQHWELEDYCLRNKKRTKDIVMEKDCPQWKEKVSNGIKG